MALGLLLVDEVKSLRLELAIDERAGEASTAEQRQHLIGHFHRLV